MKPETQKDNNFIKWVKIFWKRTAVIGSDGQVNPRQEDVSDDHIYFTVHGSGFKIACAAAEYRRQNSR